MKLVKIFLEKNKSGINKENSLIKKILVEKDKKIKKLVFI